MDVPRYLHLGYALWKGIELVDKLSRVKNPLSLVKSEVFVGTVILQVTLELAFAVKVLTVVPFFWIVKVALLTVGIVGLLLKSLYEPLVATVDKVGKSVTSLTVWVWLVFDFPSNAFETALFEIAFEEVPSKVVSTVKPLGKSTISEYVCMYCWCFWI